MILQHFLNQWVILDFDNGRQFYYPLCVGSKVDGGNLYQTLAFVKERSFEPPGLVCSKLNVVAVNRVAPNALFTLKSEFESTHEALVYDLLQESSSNWMARTIHYAHEFNLPIQVNDVETGIIKSVENGMVELDILSSLGASNPISDKVYYEIGEIDGVRLETTVEPYMQRLRLANSVESIGVAS